MTLTKISRYLINKRCFISIHPKHLCTSKSSDDKGKDGDCSDKKDNEGKSLSSICEGDNPSAPTMYDCRKYGHNLPCNSAAPYFDTLPYFPTGIFRCTYGEMLGRGAYKCGYYQNPEYFSYQHMTFYDMHLYLRQCRQPSPRTGRKP